jgi:hypothetical protein
MEYLYTYHLAQHEEGIGADARGMISAPTDIQHRERSGSHDQMSTRLLLMVVGQTTGALGFQTSVAGDLGGQPHWDAYSGLSGINAGTQVTLHHF